LVKHVLSTPPTISKAYLWRKLWLWDVVARVHPTSCDRQCIGLLKERFIPQRDKTSPRDYCQLIQLACIIHRWHDSKQVWISLGMPRLCSTLILLLDVRGHGSWSFADARFIRIHHVGLEYGVRREGCGTCPFVAIRTSHLKVSAYPVANDGSAVCEYHPITQKDGVLNALKMWAAVVQEFMTGDPDESHEALPRAKWHPS